MRVPSQGYLVQRQVDEIWESCRIDIDSGITSPLVGDKKEDTLYRAMIEFKHDQEATDEQYERLGIRCIQEHNN